MSSNETEVGPRKRWKPWVPVFIWLIVLALVTYIPELSLWLPRLLLK